MLLATLILCNLAFQATVSAQNDDDYSAYYNYEDELETSNNDLEQEVHTSAKQDVTEDQRPDPEFRADVTCSKTLLKLEIDRTVLPPGLGFADSLLEEQEEREDLGPDTCIRITHNSTHFIYKAAMKCRRAVGRLKYSHKTIFTHELVLEDTRPEKPGGRSETYSVIMDCVTSAQRSRDVAERSFTPELRVFERREGQSCTVETCPHGDLCLPASDVNGYFCSCPNLESGCECPGDFYGCSGGDNATARSLICVRNTQLCDAKYDCPLQDDEECSDTWRSWSAWSSCSASCGKGTQTRDRSCANTFSKNPSKMSKPCEELQSSESESRSCGVGECSSVQCGTETMTIEIPLEFGMSREKVEDRMHLYRGREDKECRPKVNTTHATFVIPLHKCNTSTWVDSDVIFYSNEVVYETQDQPSSIIVREYGHSYSARCQYQRRQTVSVRSFDPDSDADEMAVLKFEDENSNLDRDAERLDMMTHYSSGDGVFEYNMDIFEDPAYSTRYGGDDYPLEKRLGERLYIAVNFKSQDEDLSVFIERCWATSSGENGATDDDATYLFINGGCPVDPTVHFHNGDNNHFSDRYSIESFKFNDAQYWYIYFRCDVILCDASENDPACQRECSSPTKRRKRAVPRSSHSYGRVMQGPIVVLEEKDGTGPRHWRSGVSTGSVEHKILTFEEVQRKRSAKSDTNDGGHVFSSPYVLAAIVGGVCLSAGVTLGITLTRKNTATAKQSDKVCKEDKVTKDDEESGRSLVDNC